MLLDELMKIEAELGRDRSKKAKANGPRTIDLDLLWMDGETHGGKKLRLPHPLIGERDFVLVPLEDLMHDPARFFRYNGVEVKEPEDRVGHIVGELGLLPPAPSSTRRVTRAARACPRAGARGARAMLR